MKEILLTSSILIAALMLLRLVLKNKVSSRLQYSLWLLVAVRLLLPVQFGSTHFSAAALVRQGTALDTAITQTVSQPVSGPSYDRLFEQVTQQYTAQGADVAEPEVQAQIDRDTRQQITVPTVGELLTYLWIGGMTVMAVWFFLVNFRFLRRVRGGAKLLEVPGCSIPVRVSEQVKTPCLVGLFRPVIYLTPACAESDALPHILAHELTHLRHGDHIWSVVRSVCLCVYWFDPLVWSAARLSKRDCELACDEGALKRLGEENRLGYGRTLLDVAAQAHSPAHLLETITAMSETKRQLNDRVKRIVNRPRHYLSAAICMLLAAAIAAGCTFTGAAKVYAKEENSAEHSTIELSSLVEELPLDLPMVFYNGYLYKYQFHTYGAAFDPEDYPGSYTYVGTIRQTNDGVIPDEELSAAWLPVGTKLYIPHGLEIELYAITPENQEYGLVRTEINPLELGTDTYAHQHAIGAFSSDNDWFGAILLCPFERPEEIDLSQLFCIGDQRKWVPLEDEELAYVQSRLQCGYGDIRKISPALMDAVLQRYLGITLEQCDKVGLDKFVFYPETGCYYAAFEPDFDMIGSSGHTVVQESGLILEYKDATFYEGVKPVRTVHYVAELKPTEDGYMVLSNLLIEEPEAQG